MVKILDFRYCFGFEKHQSLRCKKYIKVLCSLHLELVHSLTSLGDVQLIVVIVAHLKSLLFFLRKEPLSEESVFRFRRPIFTRKENNTHVFQWKKTKILEIKKVPAGSAGTFKRYY